MAGHQLAATFVEPRGAIRSVIIGTIGREAILDRKKVAGVLTVTFADTDAWTFDVPKIHLGGAEDIARTLTT